MSRPRKINIISIVINFVGNTVITLVYIEHKINIRCEPCLSNFPCPPCYTEYMENVSWYYILFNAIVIVSYLILIKMNRKENQRNTNKSNKSNELNMNLLFVILFICQIFILHSQEDFIRIDKFDNSAYFQINETQNFENLTIEMLKDIVLRYPAICIEFRQMINPIESKLIARRRSRRFVKTLKKAGLNMGNFQINKSWLYVKDDDIEQRSRIQGIIFSMDSKCK